MKEKIEKIINNPVERTDEEIVALLCEAIEKWDTEV